MEFISQHFNQQNIMHFSISIFTIDCYIILFELILILMLYIYLLLNLLLIYQYNNQVMYEIILHLL
jgi:hypothetical protein